MNIYILCGIVGSGKSTWARKKAEETGAFIINRDSLRTMFNGSYKFDKEQEDLIMDCTRAITYELVDYGKDIIIDECNLTVLRRALWIDLISANSLSEKLNFVIVWFTETEKNAELREKDSLRGYTKEYWEDVISDMKVDFQQPTLNEKINGIMEVSF